MKWISSSEIDAIKRRVRDQKYPAKKTHIPQWYARFISLSLGIITSVICAFDPEPRWGFLSLLMLMSAFHQHQNWKRFQEQYVLRNELEKNEGSPAGDDVEL